MNVRPPSSPEEFTSLPARLHRRGSYEPAADTERALITGTHPLSRSLRLSTWVAEASGGVTGRIGLTTGADEPGVGYLGFLEATDRATAAGLFDAAATQAAERGVTRLIGPVNGSFWLRYRLKVTGFGERPYFGEPLNPPSHRGFWERAGFAETDRYRSVYFQRPEPGLELPGLRRREDHFRERGYELRSPDPRAWQELLADLHRLLCELYSGMPAYRPIDWPAFASLFGPMRRVADFSMIRMAYRDGRAQGFLVALPDYGVGLGSPVTAVRLATLVRHRWRSGRYVLLYLGVREPGLGSALKGSFAREIIARRAEVVGALSHLGTAGGRLPGLVRASSDYLLLGRDL